ncbi:MAG: glycosyltransferase family 4 protein, partial [bacterium]|nr:glycosyltransferase family 4 protein [bacterium]
MKKVLFVITKSNWGGAQRYVYDLAFSLPKEEYEIAVALGGHGALATKLKEDGIRVVGIPHLERDISFLKEMFSTLYLWKIFQSEKPDIIHLNSSKIGGLGALVAYILRLWDGWDRKGTERAAWNPKIIFTVHGWAFNERRNFIYQGIIYFLQWLTAFLADCIIILSRHDYRQAIEMPLIKNEKFILLPLGIKIPEFLPAEKAREFLKVDGATKILAGTVAEFTKNKGLEYLVEAVHKLKEEEKLKFNLIIIGSGEDFEKIKKEVIRLNLENEIILAGFVMDASKYLKAFDIFILPSLKEGLPYVVLEAMNAGLPIVASSVGGLTDLIENEGNGILVPPKSADQIADALYELIHHPATRKKYGEHSLVLVS